MASEHVATREQTVSALLDRSRSDRLALPRGFVGEAGSWPLAVFVKQRRGVALDLYLLARAAADEESGRVAIPSSVWARALGISPGAGAAATISKSWSWLERHGLVLTARRGRLREVAFAELASPAGEAAVNSYFELPFAYWRGDYPARLDLPAKAVLLIGLAQGESFALPPSDGGWGLSQDTLLRGSTTLIRLGLVAFSPEPRTAPLSARGHTIERCYSLRPPFGSADHSRAEGVAANRRRQRAAGLAGTSRP